MPTKPRYARILFSFPLLAFIVFLLLYYPFKIILEWSMPIQNRVDEAAAGGLLGILDELMFAIYIALTFGSIPVFLTSLIIFWRAFGYAQRFWIGLLQLAISLLYCTLLFLPQLNLQLCALFSLPAALLMWALSHYLLPKE